MKATPRVALPQDDGGKMKHETSRALYDYWRHCRRESGVRAGQLRAAELAAILPSLFLIDLGMASEPHLRFRFCGASLATRYGRDLTDESFLALWNPIDCLALKRDLGTLAFRATGMVTGVLAETVAGGFVSYEMLLLPLASERGTAGAIGSMARVGGHEEANRIRARIVGQSLRSIRFLPALREAPARATPKVHPFAMPGPVENPRRYGHLTVVSGGK